jgi:hypothetical protein
VNSPAFLFKPRLAALGPRQATLFNTQDTSCRSLLVTTPENGPPPTEHLRSVDCLASNNLATMVLMCLVEILEVPPHSFFGIKDSNRAHQTTMFDCNVHSMQSRRVVCSHDWCNRTREERSAPESLLHGRELHGCERSGLERKSIRVDVYPVGRLPAAVSSDQRQSLMRLAAINEGMDGWICRCQEDAQEI